MGEAVEPEVQMTLDDGRTFTLRMDFNTIIRVDEVMGINLMSEEVEFNKLTVAKVRDLVWCFLQDHHPDMSREEVGRMLTPLRVKPLLTKIAEVAAIAVGKAPGEAGESPAELVPEPVG